MTKKNIITWAILMILTVSGGLISRTTITYTVPLIIIFTIIKFLGVALNFMEMKKAHPFWKVLIVGYIVAFSSAILILV